MLPVGGKEEIYSVLASIRGIIGHEGTRRYGRIHSALSELRTIVYQLGVIIPNSGATQLSNLPTKQRSRDVWVGSLQCRACLVPNGATLSQMADGFQAPFGGSSTSSIAWAVPLVRDRCALKYSLIRFAQAALRSGVPLVVQCSTLTYPRFVLLLTSSSSTLFAAMANVAELKAEYVNPGTIARVQ